MTRHKRLKRIVLCPCGDCLGTGRDGRGGRCAACAGTGEVIRVVVEVVADE